MWIKPAALALRRLAQPPSQHPLSHLAGCTETAETDGRQGASAHWDQPLQTPSPSGRAQGLPIASIRPDAAGPAELDRLSGLFNASDTGLRSNGSVWAWIARNRCCVQQGDPRIHFAIVCAVIALPLLRKPRLPARAGGASKQLADDAESALSTIPKQRCVMIQNRHFYVCPARFFKWYKADFLDEHYFRYPPLHLAPSEQQAPSPFKQTKFAEVKFCRPSTRTKTEPSIENHKQSQDVTKQ